MLIFKKQQKTKQIIFTKQIKIYNKTMQGSIAAFMLFFIVNISLVYNEQQFIYTIHHSKSYRRDLLDRNMGCKQNSTIIYGTYLYPTGIKDALYVYLNQGTYQTYFSCSNQNKFFKIFGTEQNYNHLLTRDPSILANQIKQQLSRWDPTYIVNWKHPLTNNPQHSLKWLQSFIQKLSESNPNKIYLKAPASYFCYESNGIKHLSQYNINKFIIEMYGEEAGVYTSYESIFLKDYNPLVKAKQNYSEDCPKFPSYPTLLKIFAGKEIFIEKTLQKEEAGYIGPKFTQFLQKSKEKYGKVAFLDSFPEQIIEL